MKNILTLVVILVIGFSFTACATNGAGTKTSRISKVYETSYPKGISIFVENSKVRLGIEVSDARISYGNNKRQVQFILNNTSKDIYNLILDTDWTDDRGVVISTYPRPKIIRINPGSSQRALLDAPNYKAKDVLIKIKCNANCIVKPK